MKRGSAAGRCCIVPAYEELVKTADEVWKGRTHLCAFLPDHGCHDIDGGLGSHGLDMEEDMNIIHFYSFPREGI